MLARKAAEIEIDILKEPVGKQDQYAAAFGGVNFIRFHPDETVEVKKAVCPRSVLDELQSRLLFFYTGITRSASALLRAQSAKVAQHGEKSDATGELARLAETAFGDLCAGNIASFGAMLHDAWQIKRQLTDGVTNSMIDEAYRAAMDAGAEGGKILGAGGGGFLMFFAPCERHDAIRRALHPLRETPFAFAPYGSSIIFVH